VWLARGIVQESRVHFRCTSYDIRGGRSDTAAGVPPSPSPWAGARLSPFGTSATVWHIVPYPDDG
jgi:hypothetical protein